MDLMSSLTRFFSQGCNILWKPDKAAIVCFFFYQMIAFVWQQTFFFLRNVPFSNYLSDCGGEGIKQNAWKYCLKKVWIFCQCERVCRDFWKAITHTCYMSAIVKFVHERFAACIEQNQYLLFIYVIMYSFYVYLLIIVL